MDVPMLAEPLDLSFKPVSNPHPATLTAAQIEHFNRAGFIAPLDVFTGQEAQANSAYFDRLLSQIPDSGAYSINCYQARCQGIWDLCTEPRILDYVQDLIGPNIVCWASHFFCKLPGDAKRVPWHQDASYWKLTPARTVTAWLAIDDADEENAAMRFIPGSHDKGHLTFRKSAPNSVLAIETVGAEALGEPFSDTLRAGQISLHADMLVHGSEPNLSSRRRCGLTIRYCPPEVVMFDERWARSVEAILCRGQDPSGRWQHHPRPRGDDVSLQNSPHNIGGN
jgi:hypothetical protein